MKMKPIESLSLLECLSDTLLVRFIELRVASTGWLERRSGVTAADPVETICV